MNELDTPQPNETLSEQELRTLASFLFNLIEAQITRADTKAGLVVASDAVLITVSLLFTRHAALLTLFAPQAPFSERLLSLLTLVMFALLFLSMFYGLLAARPSLSVKGGGETLYFFGRISQFTHREFLDEFSKQTLRQHHESLLTEAYNTALIARQKFKRVRYSIDYLIGSLILWALVLIETALIY